MPGIGCNSHKPEIKRVLTFIIMIDFGISADFIGNLLQLLLTLAQLLPLKSGLNWSRQAVSPPTGQETWTLPFVTGPICSDGG